MANNQIGSLSLNPYPKGMMGFFFSIMKKMQFVIPGPYISLMHNFSKSSCGVNIVYSSRSYEEPEKHMGASPP